MKLIGERGDYGYFGPVGQKGEASFSGKFAFSAIHLFDNYRIKLPNWL